MPININRTGKASEAKEIALKIYSNIYDKEFDSHELKDLGISIYDLRKALKYEWIIKTKDGDRLKTYKLKPDSIVLIENYILSEETKTCTKCKKVKRVGEFNLSKTGKNGLSSVCSECVREETRKAYREKNK